MVEEWRTREGSELPWLEEAHYFGEAHLRSLAGLLAILVLIFIMSIIVTRKKVTTFDTFHVTSMDQQQDDSHTVEGSLDRENEEER